MQQTSGHSSQVPCFQEAQWIASQSLVNTFSVGKLPTRLRLHKAFVRALHQDSALVTQNHSSLYVPPKDLRRAHSTLCYLMCFRAVRQINSNRASGQREEQVFLTKRAPTDNKRWSMSQHPSIDRCEGYDKGAVCTRAELDQLSPSSLDL